MQAKLSVIDGEARMEIICNKCGAVIPTEPMPDPRKEEWRFLITYKHIDKTFYILFMCYGTIIQELSRLLIPQRLRFLTAIRQGSLHITGRWSRLSDSSLVKWDDNRNENCIGICAVCMVRNEDIRLRIYMHPFMWYYTFSNSFILPVRQNHITSDNWIWQKKSYPPYITETSKFTLIETRLN